MAPVPRCACASLREAAAKGESQEGSRERVAAAAASDVATRCATSKPVVPVLTSPFKPTAAELASARTSSGLRLSNSPSLAMMSRSPGCTARARESPMSAVSVSGTYLSHPS